jgi:hypothetical protein
MSLMKLSFDDLDGLLWQLTNHLWECNISLEVYLKEWDLLIEFAGWTEDEFLLELDGRWHSSERRSHVVFMC